VARKKVTAAPLPAQADLDAPPPLGSVVAGTPPALTGDNTRGKHLAPGMKPPWRPGESGNPNGRPPGSRNKLAEDFLADMHRQYQESGPGILRDMATSKKLSDRIRFVELVHDLLPRNAVLDVSVTPQLPRC
jgi:hypothetical protein